MPVPQGVVATLVTKAQPPKGHSPQQRNLPSLPGQGALAQPVPPLLHPLGWAQGGDSDGTRGMAALSLAPGGEGIGTLLPWLQWHRPVSPKGHGAADGAAHPSPLFPPRESCPLIQAKEVDRGKHSQAPAWKDPKAEDRVAGAEGRFICFSLKFHGK